MNNYTMSLFGAFWFTSNISLKMNTQIRCDLVNNGIVELPFYHNLDTALLLYLTMKPKITIGCF